MTRETSEWVDVKELPQPADQLRWFAETPHPDYKVQLSFAYHNFEKFRRVTFPNGDHMYSRMIAVPVAEPSPDARRGWRK